MQLLFVRNNYQLSACLMMYIFLCEAWNLRTYRFWAASEKTPSLLFTLHKERKKSPFFVEATLNISSWTLYKNTSAKGMSFVIGTFFRDSLPKVYLTSWVSQYVWRSNFPSFPLLLSMQNDVWCDVMQYDMMIWCKWYLCMNHKRKIKTLHPLRNDFGVSSPFT